MPPDDVESQVRRRLGGALAAPLLSQVFGLGVLAVLCRTVAPQDFGLWNMALPVFLYLKIYPTQALPAALVQRATLDDADARAAGGRLLSVSLGLALLGVSLTPLLAWFYRAPELWTLVPTAAGLLLVAAPAVVSQMLVERRLQLADAAWGRFAARTIGGLCAIAAALSGWGVWSLVVQQYVELLGLIVVFQSIAPCRPTSSAAAPATGSFAPRFTFGSIVFLTISSIGGIMLARARGETALGFYSQAFGLAQTLSGVASTAISGVLFPALARAQSQPEVARRMLLTAYRGMAFVLWPASVGLACIAPEAVVLLGGERWRAAGAILQPLALGIAVQGAFNLVGSIYLAAGRADALVRAALAALLVVSAAQAMAVALGGDDEQVAWRLGAAYSLALAGLVLGPYLGWGLKLVNATRGDWLATQQRAFVASLAIAPTVYGVRAACEAFALPGGAFVVASIALGAGVYALLNNAEGRALVAAWRKP